MCRVGDCEVGNLRARSGNIFFIQHAERGAGAAMQGRRADQQTDTQADEGSTAPSPPRPGWEGVRGPDKTTTRGHTHFPPGKPGGQAGAGGRGMGRSLQRAPRAARCPLYWCFRLSWFCAGSASVFVVDERGEGSEREEGEGGGGRRRTERPRFEKQTTLHLGHLKDVTSRAVS